MDQPSTEHDRAMNEKHEVDEPAQEEPAQRQLHGFSWFLVVIATLSSCFLFGLDNTVAADIQPAVVQAFGSIDRLPWISVTFLLASASTTLFWGHMYNQYNAKWLYISCVTVFELGNVVCGAAPSMTALIVGRALCGLGGGGMYTGVVVILSILTLEKERARYLGMIGLFWGTGTVLGPIIGGAFTSSSAGWRWAFYINLCVGGLLAPVFLFILPSIDAQKETSLLKRAKQIDFVGTIILSGVVVSGIMAISFGGTVYPWNSGSTIALFVVAVVLVMVFLAQQVWCIGTTATQRIFPIGFLRQPSLVLVFILECCASTITFVPIYFLPLYFQFVRQESAILAGVHLLPFVIFLVAVVIVNGIVISVNGRYMPWFLVGGIFGTIGSALLYTTDEYTSNARIYGYSILIGIGGGAFCQLPFSVVQSLVNDPALIPVAVGFVTFAQLISAAVALAVANSVFLNQSFQQIEAAVPSLSTQDIQGILSGVTLQVLNSLDPRIKQTIVHIVVSTLNKSYIVTLTAGVLAIVLSLFLSRGNMYAPKN